MSRIDDLIERLCPSGVPHRALGEFATLVRGSGMPKADFADAGVGAIHYGQIYTRYGAWTTSTISFVPPAIAARLAKVDPGDIVITNTSENVEDVGKAVAWLGESQIVTGGHATVIKHHEDPKYLSYWFQSASFLAQKKALATGTKVIDVSAKQLAKVRLPVPPAEVQREIVRVLDTFQELEGELEAELEARRRQYAHYRDSLLTFPLEEAGWAPLREVITYTRGVTYAKSDEVRHGGAGHRVLRSNNIDLDANRLDLSDVRVINESVRIRADQRLKKDDILVSAASGSKAHVGKVAFVGDDMDYVFGGFMAVVRVTTGVLPRYLFHQLVDKSFADYLDSTIPSTTINNLTGEIIGNFRIPVPSIEEQSRIVAILDTFDTLVNGLTVGLPAELAARRQQYAYYRDRLLTFREVA